MRVRLQNNNLLKQKSYQNDHNSFLYNRQWIICREIDFSTCNDSKYKKYLPFGGAQIASLPVKEKSEKCKLYWVSGHVTISRSRLQTKNLKQFKSERRTQNAKRQSLCLALAFCVQGADSKPVYYSQTFCAPNFKHFYNYIFCSQDITTIQCAWSTWNHEFQINYLSHS